MKDTNYFSVQAWMVTKLKLKGVERDVYAILYGFTQDNESECRCSYTYMSTITGYTKRAIMDAMDRLEAKHLIVKSGSDSDKDMRNIYKCNFDFIDGVLKGGEPGSLEGGEPGSPLNELGGEPGSPHNINNKNNTYNKGTGAGASFKNHSQVYKKRESLNDDLESGKDIDKQKSDKRKSPKEKFRDECYSLIDSFVTDNHLDSAVHDLLIEYFDFISDIKQADGDDKLKVVRNTSTWEKKLNKQLLELIENGYNPIDIIQQSLEQRRYKFWEPDSASTNNNKCNYSKKGGELLDDKIVGNDVEEARRRLEEDESEEWY